MSLSITIKESLSLQATHELTNVIKYKILATYFDKLKLNKIAKKFYAQSDEEYAHYSKIIEYLNTRIGGNFKYYSPNQIDIIISSPKQAADLYVAVEVGTTKALEEISEQIREEKSYIDFPFIDEMLKIQVIEEDEAEEFYRLVYTCGDIVLLNNTLE